jgi:fumarate hydratase subunit alpha/L(+)-tartrate dehydratase alpha subunit
MLKAVDIADQKKTLVCQDTGLPIYMVKLGSLFHWDGAEIENVSVSGPACRPGVPIPRQFHHPSPG